MSEKPEPENEKTSDTSSKALEMNNALLGILGNAMNSSLKYTQANAGLETKRCPNCSAARPVDTDLQYCAFCGHKFY